MTAHCPNTGAMTGCWEPGVPVQLSASGNPRRKLKWTLERVNMGGGWIGVNTYRVNHIIRSFIHAGMIAALAGYDAVKSEPVYAAPGFDQSRFDFLLTGRQRTDCYVEIKNATLLDENTVLFPDAITGRGRKHVQLLQHAVRQGCRAVMLYAVNRPEGNTFAVASRIDPDYHRELVAARRAGVELMALRLRHTDVGVEAGENLPVSLE